MMGISRRALATVLASLLVTSSLASPVLAQPAPTPAQEQQARDLTKKAIAKSQGGDHQQAVDLYLDAYKLVPNAMLLSNVGAEYQQMNKPVEALRYFCMYLEKDPTGTNASFATSQAKLLQMALGNKDVNDDNVCKPPQPPPEPEPDTGDGTGVTGTTGLGVTATSGSSDPGKALKIAGIIGAGLGVAGLGAGIYFGLEAKRISDDITNHCKEGEVCMPWPGEIDQLEKDGQAAENKQIAFLIGGGVLAVAGAVVYVVGRSKSNRERPTVSANVGNGAVGLLVNGRF